MVIKMRQGARRKSTFVLTRPMIAAVKESKRALMMLNSALGTVLCAGLARS